MSMGPLRASHAGITWVKSIKKETKFIFLFMTNKIEKNKFKNKMRVGLTTGTSHKMNPQYENNWYQGAIYFSQV